jgi:hypothetical protein
MVSRLLHTSQYYLAAFRPEDIVLREARPAGVYAQRGDRIELANAVEIAHGRGVFTMSASPESGTWTCDDLELSFAPRDGVVAPADIEAARRVLARVVELDASARHFEGLRTDDELAGICIGAECVEFEYSDSNGTCIFAAVPFVPGTDAEFQYKEAPSPP